ncbi:LCP family protein [Papillibacter cinnamivorans]|uniref:Transcriptional attenuator, LytR family n=1 Tax=Papillibacter cinnamivorans DSM 12816 TaxID=1122930 RepID=A0A1W2A4D0_9FIRM|nr:LCP family protein [Papillibacter cinnamivorans]SMC55322.1 transcriptional attenuator, LytR family [Papillibacter cinnamivorans DSM 12816]
MANGRRQKKRRARRWLLLIPVCIIVVCVIAFQLLVRAPETPPDLTSISVTDNPETSVTEVPALRKSNFYTFLLCGTDDGNGGTDTIMVASYDTKNQEVNVVSVPRDTLVDVSWDTKKINSTYNYGGTELLKQELSRILGFTPDFTIKVDLQGFVDIVDKVGGVDFYVPTDMSWPDPYIDLKEGQQTLDGEHALMLVRMRHCYATQDLGRIETQQAFLKALVQQTLKISNATKIAEFAQIFKDYVTTDLSAGNLIWFGKEALGLDMDNVHFYTLPGDGSGYYNGISYFILEPEKTLALVNRTVNPFTADIPEDQIHIFTGE